MTSTLLRNIERNLLSDRTAIRMVGGSTTTYTQLYDASRSIAAGLKGMGIGKGHRVLLLAKPSARVVSFVLASLRLGVVVVIADPGMGKEVLAARIKQSRPDAVLLDPALSMLRYHPVALAAARRRDTSIPDVFGVAMPRIILDTDRTVSRHMTVGKLQQSSAVDSVKTAMSDGDEAIIVYTSGSTALPKGVVHTHGSLAASISVMESIVDKDNRLYTKLAYFLLVGIGIGAEIIVDSDRKRPAKVLEALDEYQATCMFGPPAEFLKLYEHVHERHEMFPVSVRHILFGSAPVHTSFLQKIISVTDPSVRLSCLYGMTEALPIAYMDGRRKAVWTGRGDVLGKPVKGIDVHIRKGELYVSGESVAAKYIEADVHSEVATGDLVRQRADGTIVLMGRRKDMILRCSFNIYPELYESTIERITGVRACAMVGVYDETIHDEQVWLCVEWETTAKRVDISRLHSLLQSGDYSIDSDALPDAIIYIQLPRSGRQRKIDKQALRKLCASQ